MQKGEKFGHNKMNNQMAHSNVGLFDVKFNSSTFVKGLLSASLSN